MSTYEVSNQSLAKATAGAIVAALLILGLFVLPAERGIDVTGVGGALGLTKMAKVPPVPETPGSIAAAVTHGGDLAIPTKQTIVETSAYRSDEMELVLPPNSGAEIKAQMLKGDHYIFRWEATGGAVTVDMHGERPHAGKAFTSYWKAADQTSAQGAFTAPFDGTHGWYWRNRGDETVRIKVRTSGFYERLFRPGAE